MKKLIAAIILCACIKAIAQEYNFRKFTTEDGLSLSQISILLQHPNETLIVGTYGGGIDFYDGITFQNVGVKDGLSSNLIYSLLLTPENNLWIGTSKGLDLYKQDGTIINYKFPEIKETIIWDLIYYGDKIWVCAENGIYNISHDTIKTVISNIRGLSSAKTDSTLLIGTNRGLISIRNENDYLSIKQFKDKFIRTLLVDNEDRIFLGTDEGLILYSQNATTTFSIADGLSDSEIYTLFQETNGTIWIGTEKGLDRYSNGKFTSFNLLSGINEYRIWDIMEDNSNSLWFAADDGLYFLNDDNFKIYKRFNHIPLDVWTINKNEKLLIGTHGQGILEFNNGGFKEFAANDFLKDKIIRSIEFDNSKTRLFIGTDKGFFAHNYLTNKTEKIAFPNNSLDYDIVNIFHDSSDNIWLSTIFDGLYKISKENILYEYKRKDSASLNSVYKIIEDKNKNLWMGTENGIVLYSNDKFNVPKSIDWLYKHDVLSLKLENENTLWAGVYSYGVLKFDISDIENPKLEKVITTSDGLTDNSILAMLIDNHKLWVGTNFGINLIDLKLMETSEHFVKPFTKHLGIPGLEFLQNSIFQENDSSIWFGSIKGLVNFNPQKIEVTLEKPNVFISKFIVSNQDNQLSYAESPLESILFKEQLELEYNQNNITIEFKSNSFPVENNITYQYRLGDENWSKLSREKSVNFYNLPPGNYIFEVRTAKYGILFSDPTSIKFSIAEPFWLSNWFYLIVFLLFILTVYLIYRYRVNLLHKKNIELQKRIEERKKHQEELELWQKELIAAKELAEKSDRLKSEFLAQMSHEIRTPINSILNFSYLLKESLSDKVDSDLKDAFSIIDRGGKRLIKTIDSILNMSQIQVGNFDIKIETLDLVDIIAGLSIEFKQSIVEKGIRFELLTDCKSSIVNADEYTSSQIFANLIDNAFKYTNDGEIRIKFYNPDDSHISIEVSDTGIGISEENLETVFHPFSQEESGYTRRYEGVGLGLALVKKYCELNNAEIRVASKKNIGTTITVTYKLSQPILQ